MASASDATGTRSAYPTGPFRQVLVGWDGSNDAVTALRTAAAIVANSAGRVVALAVLSPSAGGEESGIGESVDALTITNSFEQAKAALMLSSPARVSLHVARDRHIAQSICAYAVEHGFDLIVLGRHGEGNLLPRGLGRVAESAARASRIPVLLLGAG
jgi:nucleotide-binding universal stress UspA family protein